MSRTALDTDRQVGRRELADEVARDGVRPEPGIRAPTVLGPVRHRTGTGAAGAGECDPGSGTVAAR